jgi:hypothetical protein
MAQMAHINDYEDFLFNFELLKLSQLPKLTKEQIAIHYPNHEYNRIVLYLCYGYYDELDIYDNSHLLYNKIITLALKINNSLLKSIKYLESRGFDFKKDEYFLTAVQAGSIKTMKYLKSLGIYILVVLIFIMLINKVIIYFYN